MKKIIASLLVGMVFSTSAMAWGEREQGIVTGVAGLWIFQQLNKAGEPQHPPVVIQQQPPVIIQQQPQVIYQQAPRQQYCEWTTVVDQFGTQRGIHHCYYR